MLHLEAEVSPGWRSEGEEEEEDEMLHLKEPAQTRLSGSSLAKLFAFSFGNGVLLSSYFIVTLPIESKRISADSSALYLGGFVGVAGLTQLVCPVVGLVSDKFVHPWGRRRPFILYGGIAGVLGLFLQWFARTYSIWTIYIVAFSISMVALNVIYSSMNGLIADFIPEEQVGQANGMIAMLSVLGAVSSFVAFQVLGDLYLFYIVVIASTCLVTFAEAGRVAMPSPPPTGVKGLHLSSEELWKAFTISPTEHRDFFLILISRTLYYMGISSQAYLMYFIRDVINNPVALSESESESFTAELAVIGQLCGVLTAFPAGYLSDVLKNGRKRYIYGSCAALALGNIALIFCSTKSAIIGVTCLLGAANGVYLTMDGSLAVDALPSKEEAARFLGIWGVGAFVGTSLGPIIGGPVLIFNPNQSGTGYALIGYAILLSLSAIYLTASAFTLRSTTVE